MINRLNGHSLNGHAIKVVTPEEQKLRNDLALACQWTADEKVSSESKTPEWSLRAVYGSVIAGWVIAWYLIEGIWDGWTPEALKLITPFIETVLPVLRWGIHCLCGAVMVAIGSTILVILVVGCKIGFEWLRGDYKNGDA